MITLAPPLPLLLLTLFLSVLLPITNDSILNADSNKIKPISVVTSINPLAGVVREICREACIIKTLLSGRVDPHSYEPKPSQMRELVESDLIVFNGAGFEGWAKGSLAYLGDKVIELANFSDTIGQDPHLWLDPSRIIDFSDDIKSRLCALRATDCKAFQENCASFKEKLSDFDRGINSQFEKLTDKTFLAYHPAWAHYAKRYGLIQLSVLAHDEMQQPSPVDLAKSIALGKSGKVKLLVVEPASPIHSLDNMIKNGGFRVVTLDPIGEEGEGYIDLMRRNSEILILNLRDANEQ